MTTCQESFEPEGDMNIPELQQDLQRKYRNVGGKVKDLWRDFTPKQRAKAMRETVGDGKVLKNSRDPGLEGLKDVNPDWNLEDITSDPDFFLQRWQFRAETDLRVQFWEGANGGPGDRQVIDALAQRRTHAWKDEWTLFVDRGKDYGKYVTPNGAEGRRSMEDFASRHGLMVPAHVGELILSRQRNTFIFYNHLIEEILELGSETRGTKTPTKRPTEATTSAMANLEIDPMPMKASISEIIAQAVEQKETLEDWLSCLRSEPVALNQAVRKRYYSRPELVADDRGRIVPLFTDKYLSTAFFEVMNEAIKGIVIWDYIIRLLRLLDGLDDKVKRPLLMQELSNTCHFEYRRVQDAFRRQMSVPLGVASKNFKRVTTGDISKIVMKGQPSDVTVADPQLHNILRLCHPDTSHKSAADWVQKLDDHDSRYPDDRARLVETQAMAFGDLAIIVSFMHTISNSIAMVPSSRKSGLFFTSRAAAMDTELAQYKTEADLGDHLVPMDNILEPGVAAKALQALDDFLVAEAGASFGSLYEDMVQECLDDAEQEYAKVKARLEKDEKRTTYVPLPTKSEPISLKVDKVERRREKEKTRPSEARIYDITAIVPAELDNTIGPPPRLQVKASTASVFATIFSKSEARGSVPWADFAAAMADLQFSVTPKGGSVYTFNPPESLELRPITLHRPHISNIEGYKVLILARRLNRAYRWDAETFEVI